MKIKSGLFACAVAALPAGRSMDLYRYLRLDELECSVAIIKNVKSNAMGRKDIIKVDDDISIDLDVLGYIDPGITVNIIENGAVKEKKHLSLPERLTNIIHCKNPRCITSVEPALDHVFVLSDREKGVYRCIYCDSKH